MFIVIDGLDGSGKGTQTKLVVAELEKQGKKVLLLDYPRYGENSAYFVEQYLNGKYGTTVSAKRASLFYALDRFDDLHNAQNTFSDYDYIISNRYVSASMIHQAGKIQDPIKRIEFLDWLAELEFGICGVPKPDKVLFLDVPPEVSQRLVETKQDREYIKDGSNKDIHEADDNHMNNAYGAALQVVEHFSDSWEKIECCENGNILPIDIITQKILNKI
ncbi:thymidylate kinase [Candidatus Gracilibacteria bacterium]|nr:thymidylate kinase [Candidatus Gracilibacteria bacterium]